jgi:hypothetical protein
MDVIEKNEDLSVINDIQKFSSLYLGKPIPWQQVLE